MASVSRFVPTQTFLAAFDAGLCGLVRGPEGAYLPAMVSPRSRVLTALLLLAACNKEPSAATPPESEPAPLPVAEPEETEAPDPKAHMQEHLRAATEARDAIIGGDLERARKPLGWLAGHVYPDTLPPTWRFHAIRMGKAAEAAAGAKDLPGAARAIGSMAATCGGCHSNIEGGPKLEPAGFERIEDQDLPDRMHRHVWAIERLWEGLTVPAPKAFRVGAEVLAEGAFDADRGPAERLALVRPGLDEVQRLGRIGIKAEGLELQSEVYGELLVHCSRCHAALGIDFGAAAADQAPEPASPAPPGSESPAPTR